LVSNEIKSWWIHKNKKRSDQLVKTLINRLLNDDENIEQIWVENKNEFEKFKNENGWYPGFGLERVISK
jgi:hypothetical protein